MRPGDLIDGRYRLEQLLGRGGMGAVFSAEHLLLETKVAIKFLVDARSQEAVVRFAREARVTARLTSAHATRVMDVATPSDRDRPPYLVMELLQGTDLDAILRERGPLSVEKSVGYLLQACDAIAEAHANGVVHRDIKPGNLFLARQPNGTDILKVLDFGLSKLVEATEAPNVTRTTAIMGSPAYMSPEQLRNPKRVDVRTDVWALGVVLYELLTKELPFRFDSTADLLIAIATEPHVPIRKRLPSLAEGVEAVVERCLSKKPEDRYPDVVEFARAITPFAALDDRRRLDIIERRASDAPLSTPARSWGLGKPNPSPHATTLDAVAVTTRFSARRAGLVIFGGVLFIGITAAVFHYWWGAPDGIPIPIATQLVPHVDTTLDASPTSAASATTPLSATPPTATTPAATTPAPVPSSKTSKPSKNR